MFAGHIGAALVIGRVERRVNVGVFVGAALLLDLVLWLLVLLGLESVVIPSSFTSTHQPEFVFPYSHGLLAAVLWSAVAGAPAFLACSDRPALKWRAAVLIAAAVVSHWLLDALVHRPEMPLTDSTSRMVGLALWNSLFAALGVEALVVAVGLYLFVPGSGLSRSRSVTLTVLTLVILFFTVAGMTVAPPPPSTPAMAGTSLVTLGVVCAMFCWLGRHPRAGGA
jgi:hypothetical protein